MDEYKRAIIAEGDRLINCVLAEKVLELNAMLQSSMFDARKFDEIYGQIDIQRAGNAESLQCDGGGGDIDTETEEPVAKRPRHDVKSAIVPISSNKPLCAFIDILKPIIRKLIQHTISLKMWLTFMIPKVEDGNNFGIAVQQNILMEIQSVEANGHEYLAKIASYFVIRGKIVSKTHKFPFIDDYYRAIAEVDLKEFSKLHIILSEIRNHYSIMYDLITKNIEKLRKPRSIMSSSLY